VPCGKVASESGSQLPVGLQILGPHMGEQAILKVARAVESSD
jgi:aspartyl-tRNA(Asn)/glutamyl-tRNA(Gln) amidotransferase subunit A